MTTPDANADPSSPSESPAEPPSPVEPVPPSPVEPVPASPVEPVPASPVAPGLPSPVEPVPAEPESATPEPPAPQSPTFQEPDSIEDAADTVDRRRRWPWIVAIGVVAAVVVVLVGSYRIYGEWPWSAYPSRLHACGIGFEHHGAQTRAQIAAQGDTLVPMGKVPGWLNSGKLFTTSSGSTLVGQKCHGRMWVQTGSDTFQLYSEPTG